MNLIPTINVVAANGETLSNSLSSCFFIVSKASPSFRGFTFSITSVLLTFKEAK